MQTAMYRPPQASGFDPTGSQGGHRCPADILAAAVWLALVTSLAEGLYWFVQGRILGSLTFLHPGFLWMSPLAQLACFLVPATLLAVVARFYRGRSLLTFSVTLLSLLAWLNLLLLVPLLHYGAWVLAGCGLASASGRYFQKREQRCLRAMHRSAVWMGAFVALTAAVQTILPVVREARSLASLPRSTDRAPNLLLIVLDTVRADALGSDCVNGDVTPNLCRLAGQGTVFEQAWATAPWTLPSHAGMFTGRMPHELSAGWGTGLDGRYRTLAEALAERGWLTAGFVGNTRYCSAETGLARGFIHYEDYRLSPADFALCTALGRKLLLGDLPVQLGLCQWPGRKSADEINDSFLRWLRGRPRRPYFAFLNYWDAHDPYQAPRNAQSGELARNEDARLLRNWWWADKEKVTDRQVAMLRSAYRDCIRGLDRRVGQLLDRLRDAGELDNTLVIVTADHGEHFGEQGLFLHGNSLYQSLLHVPLIAVWPGEIPAGLRVRTPVSLSGLPNTILETLDEAPRFPGNSWVRHWSNPDPSGSADVVTAEIAALSSHPPCHGRSPVARGPMRCVRQGDLKYIRNGDGAEELYDVARDPGESANLAGHQGYAVALDRLRCILPGAASGAVAR